MPKYDEFFQKLFIGNFIVILVLSLTPGNGSMLDPLDKLAHFLMYFSFTFSIAGWVRLRKKMTSPIFVAIVLGIMIEFIQEYIPGRGFEYWDIIANSAGAISGPYFFQWKKDWIFEKIK